MGKLIRLELFNFKSYKGHHVLLFGDSYFTSIIGPNGSGKSNSMDAISFVLGIKSSHLRSNHLRDLVYRGRILKTSKINADGTATDQPATNGHADLNRDTNGDAPDQAGSDIDDTQRSSQRNDPTSAWVMAVYEDDAGDEQKWKRVITSSGSSEYRINSRAVSAKQYNEALEAENILIKARNFLVFQGDVEAIASQSPKDLTRLVEQISGSLEYKAEYDKLEEDAEKARDDQISRLDQRRAINAEIKQFTEQKREADNYNKKVQERDDAIVTHVLWKLYHFQRVIEQSEAEIQKHQDEIKEHRRGIEKYQKRLDTARREQAKAGRDVSKAETAIKVVEREIEDQSNALVPVEEKITISNSNLERYESRLASVGKEKSTQSSSVDQLKKDLAVVQKAQAKWEAEFQTLAQQQGRQLSQNDIQQYNRLKSDINKRTANAQIKLDHLTRQCKTDEETVKSLRSTIEEHERHISRLDGEINEMNLRHDTAGSTVRETGTDIDKKKKQLNTLTSERLRMSQKHTELEEKLQEVLNKLLEADDGRRTNEREARARETIVAMKRIFPGVRGRVHELCKPKQKKYETAVSTVLGRHFDAIVVDTEKIAKDCIQYLRDQRAGQATFIPLDTIQVKGANSSMKGLHKNMRLAIDTVEYDHAYERAISYACGNAMVCDDLKTAKHLCYERHIEAKAVTLDGIVIHKGGLMTGGRGPNDRTTRKWEDNEVDNLRRLKDKLLADLEALPKGHKTVTEEETLQGELTGLMQKLEYFKEEVKALHRNVQDKKGELLAHKKQLEDVKPKYKSRDQALQQLRKQLEQAQEEISGVEDQIFAQFCQRLGYTDIRAYEAQQGSLQQEGAQKKLEFSMQRSKIDNQLTFEVQRLSATKERIRSIENQSQRDQDLIASLEAEKEAIQAAIDDLDKRLSGAREKLVDLRDTHNEKVDKAAEYKRDVQKRSKEVDQAMKAITDLETELQRNATSRYALLRKCKINETKIPLAADSKPLESLPGDDMLQPDPDAMDVDDSVMHGSLQAQTVHDYGIAMDFEELEDNWKEDDSDHAEGELEAAISALNAELQTLNPNMRAMDRLTTAQDRAKQTESAFVASRDAARKAQDAFYEVREKRGELFKKAFEHISAQIGPVYKALTRSQAFPLGGQAYLDTTVADDDEAPFLGGLKYHAMPPLKRFRDMDALSGGEKTIAALALLFAVHSFAPSPFFVLDEVDAALDNANVAKVAKYIKEHAGPGMQFIVISLKTGLFQESECLVGVLRDQAKNTSRTVTLDLRKYLP